MVFKKTLVYPLENSGILKIRTFHTYKKHKNGGLRNFGFLYGSIRDFTDKSKNLLGKKKKFFFFKSKKPLQRKDLSTFIFFKNTGVTLKKRLTIKGSLVKGPFLYTIKKKKLKTSFSLII